MERPRFSFGGNSGAALRGQLREAIVDAGIMTPEQCDEWTANLRVVAYGNRVCSECGTPLAQDPAPNYWVDRCEGCWAKKLAEAEANTKTFSF